MNAPSAHLRGSWVERAVRFGAHGGLVGVLTEPAANKAIANAPTVLVSNIGLNNHVGPYRLWVDLARALADNGFTTLRFDSAGLGDSEPRRETVSDIERAVLDFGDAMKLTGERLGSQRFVPMGLCSGVDSVHLTAVRDPRVVGAAFLDGYAYRTSGYMRRHHVGRWFQWARWRRFVRRRWIYNYAAATKGVRETGEVDEIFVRDYPTLERLAQDYAAMLARGARLFFAYTGEVDHSYNGATQLYEMFPNMVSSKAVDLEYYPKADHVYSFIRDRRILVARLTRWMNQAFK